MSPPTSSPPCPDAAVLSQYVLGMLTEADAAALAAHVDACPPCQQHLDDLAQERDSLLAPVRRARAAGAAHDPTDLARLIERAQRLRPHPAVTTPAPGKSYTAPVSAAVFMTCLRQSGLLSPAEVETLVASSPGADSVALARDLLLRRKLTPFQARMLLRGRWKGLVLGNYVILARLGQGGMSAVFKARHRRLGRLVCLKVPLAVSRRSPEIVERFRREARTVAALRHPHIVVAHDADEADGIPFLAMEFIEGRDLARLVAEQGPLPPRQAIDLVLQAARALDYAHRQGVIHRDVKPHNLLLDASGTVKVLDMGLARFDTYLDPGPDATTHASLTASGVIMGTVDYLAPEQALNSRRADHRSDIYSLGCTLYFLLTGRVLYAGETLMEKLVAHREHAIPPLGTAVALAQPAGVSPGLEAVFRRMVAKDPVQRYPSMAALVSDLEAVQAGRPPTALADAAPEAGTRRRIRHGMAAGAGVGVIALGVWLAPSAWPPPAPGPDQDAPPVSPGPPPPRGHPQARAQGGPGRALLVVPHAWFNEDHYLSMEKALMARGIGYATASSQAGAAKPKQGAIAPVSVDLTLDRIRVDDFDAVVFLGGNVEEFTQRSALHGERVHRLIEECLDRGRVVAALGTGRGVLEDTGLTEDCTFEQVGSCAVGRLSGRPGALLTTSDGKGASELVQLLLAAAAPTPP